MLRPKSKSKLFWTAVGQNTTTGVMDSGAWLGNPDLDTPRITATHVTGVYGSSGNRYPQSIYATIQKGVVPTASKFFPGRT